MKTYSQLYHNPLQNLQPEHFQEWLGSAVDPEIIALNVKSISGDNAYGALLYGLPNSERRNDGRLRDKWMSRYAHLVHGGWWAAGIDILTGEEAQWGCYKPDRASIDKDGKPIKYEHPPKVPTEIFCLRVTYGVGLKIAQKAGLENAYRERIFSSSVGAIVVEGILDYEDKGFWQWVQATAAIPVVVTEGVKKAGALLTAGYVAIALPGIFGGYRREKDDSGKVIGLPRLIPQLEPFAIEGREISFCFDHDLKPKTVQNVRQAIEKTGKLLKRKKCKVSVVTWDYPEKGVDDLIAALGVECFDTLYKSRSALDKFVLQGMLDLSPYVDLTVNQRYLSNGLVPPPDAQIIGLKAPKGTGKTEWLSKQVEKAIATGTKVLVVTHRIQLTKELCNRFGIDHLEEIKTSETRGVLGFGLCIDSLHPNSQARFTPEEWQGASLVIDECEQVFWHLLNSSTCQKYRVSILETFQELLQTVVGTGGRIFLSDADLSPISIDWIERLIAFPVKRWIVENTFIPNLGNRTLYTYQSQGELVTALLAAISQGQKVIIHTSSQKIKSKWGTRNLESLFLKRFKGKGLKILRIDSESVSDPEHPAYGCMGNLNAILPQYDIVIASPTIETGISIDVKHFDSVWCLAQGIQTVDGVCQTLERVRSDIPRHLFAPKQGLNFITNRSTNIKELLRNTHQISKCNITLAQLAQFDSISYLEDVQPETLISWAKRAALINSGFWNYRDSIALKLASEGYKIIEATNYQSLDDETLPTATEVIEEIKTVAKENYQDYCQSVCDTEAPSQAKLEELKNKRAKTETERLEEKKGDLCERYQTDQITPEIVEKDDDGWYPQLRLQYFLTIGHCFLKKRDRRSLDLMAESGNGKFFKPDINKKQLSAKIFTLEVIGIKQFLDASCDILPSPNASVTVRASQLDRSRGAFYSEAMPNPTVELPPQDQYTPSGIPLTAPETESGRLLPVEAEFTCDSLKEWYEKISQPTLRYQIKAILGITINPEKDSPIAVAQRLLGLLGLHLEFLEQRGRRGEKRLRVYKGCNLDPDGRQAIFERWIRRDSELYHSDTVHTPSNRSLLREVCA